MNLCWPVAKLSSIEVGMHVCHSYACPSQKNLVTLALVLATGSRWSGPIDLPDSEADLRKLVSQWREKFKAAEDIVIVGGGAVGVELSGEIRDEYPVCCVPARCVLELKPVFRTRRLQSYTPKTTS